MAQGRSTKIISMINGILSIMNFLPRRWDCTRAVRKAEDECGITDRCIRNPNPETRYPKSETWKPKPETRDPKPETRNRIENRKMKLESLKYPYETLNPERRKQANHYRGNWGNERIGRAQVHRRWSPSNPNECRRRSV
jgi:hypothetical protein